MGDILEELRLFREKMTRPAANISDAPQRGHRNVSPALPKGLFSSARWSVNTDQQQRNTGMLRASTGHSLKKNTSFFWMRCGVLTSCWTFLSPTPEDGGVFGKRLEFNTAPGAQSVCLSSGISPLAHVSFGS